MEEDYHSVPGGTGSDCNGLKSLTLGVMNCKQCTETSLELSAGIEVRNDELDESEARIDSTGLSNIPFDFDERIALLRGAYDYSLTRKDLVGKARESLIDEACEVVLNWGLEDWNVVPRVSKDFAIQSLCEYDGAVDKCLSKLGNQAGFLDWACLLAGKYIRDQCYRNSIELALVYCAFLKLGDKFDRHSSWQKVLEEDRCQVSHVEYDYAIDALVGRVHQFDSHNKNIENRKIVLEYLAIALRKRVEIVDEPISLELAEKLCAMVDSNDPLFDHHTYISIVLPILCRFMSNQVFSIRRSFLDCVLKTRSTFTVESAADMLASCSLIENDSFSKLVDNIAPSRVFWDKVKESLMESCYSTRAKYAVYVLEIFVSRNCDKDDCNTWKEYIKSFYGARDVRLDNLKNTWKCVEGLILNLQDCSALSHKAKTLAPTGFDQTWLQILLTHFFKHPNSEFSEFAFSRFLQIYEGKPMEKTGAFGRSFALNCLLSDFAVSIACVKSTSLRSTFLNIIVAALENSENCSQLDGQVVFAFNKLLNYFLGGPSTFEKGELLLECLLAIDSRVIYDSIFLTGIHLQKATDVFHFWDSLSRDCAALAHCIEKARVDFLRLLSMFRLSNKSVAPCDVLVQMFRASRIFVIGMHLVDGVMNVFDDWCFSTIDVEFIKESMLSGNKAGNSAFAWALLGHCNQQKDILLHWIWLWNRQKDQNDKMNLLIWLTELMQVVYENVCVNRTSHDSRVVLVEWFNDFAVISEAFKWFKDSSDNCAIVLASLFRSLVDNFCYSDFQVMERELRVAVSVFARSLLSSMVKDNLQADISHQIDLLSTLGGALVLVDSSILSDILGIVSEQPSLAQSELRFLKELAAFYSSDKIAQCCGFNCEQIWQSSHDNTSTWISLISKLSLPSGDVLEYFSGLICRALDTVMAQQVIVSVFTVELCSNARFKEKLRFFWDNLKCGAESRMFLTENLLFKVLQSATCNVLDMWITEIAELLVPLAETNTSTACVHSISATRFMALLFCERHHFSGKWITSLITQIVPLFFDQRYDQIGVLQALAVLFCRIRSSTVSQNLDEKTLSILRDSFFQLVHNSLDGLKGLRLVRYYFELTVSILIGCHPQSLARLTMSQLDPVHGMRIEKEMSVVLALSAAMTYQLPAQDAIWAELYPGLVKVLLPYCSHSSVQGRQLSSYLIRRLISEHLAAKDSNEPTAALPVYESLEIRRFLSYSNTSKDFKNYFRLGERRMCEYDPDIRCTVGHFFEDYMSRSCHSRRVRAVLRKLLTGERLFRKSAPSNESIEFCLRGIHRHLSGSVENVKDFTHHQAIVLGSLLQKAPNAGGLTRTCELLSFRKILFGENFCANKYFQETSCSADSWIDSAVIPLEDMKDYMESMSLQGYTIIVLEQSDHSICISKCKFPEDGKVLFLLGSEKYGVPAHLLNAVSASTGKPLVDISVEIPQLGMTRSLNVHCSAAILFYEYVKQQMHLSGGRSLLKLPAL